MEATIALDQCFQCMCPLKPGESAKKDFPICKRCFDAMYAMERATIRKLVFSEADHIIDNIYLGPQGSAIDLEYLKTKKIDRIIVAAAYTEVRFPKDIDYLKLDVDDSPEEDLYRFF